uniref:Retrotransposon protein, putative, Ty3-gypsy subclass n=1 Tax=Oryza sativa subsp. japonica TaxID=39947 RepID=Q2QQE7_ORYSJ|nr:retrotransposon protein, putative, Ty3-gypsy subclass [Oryza sativa Japonica Group]
MAIKDRFTGNPGRLIVLTTSGSRGMVYIIGGDATILGCLLRQLEQLNSTHNRSVVKWFSTLSLATPLFHLSSVLAADGRCQKEGQQQQQQQQRVKDQKMGVLMQEMQSSMQDVDAATVKSEAAYATTMSPTTDTSSDASPKSESESTALFFQCEHLQLLPMSSRVLSKPAQLSHHRSLKQQALPMMLWCMKAVLAKCSTFMEDVRQITSLNVVQRQGVSVIKSTTLFAAPQLLKLRQFL